MRITNVEYGSVTIELTYSDFKSLALALDTAADYASGLVPLLEGMEEGSPEAGEWAARWRVYQTSFAALALTALAKLHMLPDRAKTFDLDLLRNRPDGSEWDLSELLDEEE